MCKKIVLCVFCHDNFTQICFHGTQRDLYVLNGKCVPRLCSGVEKGSFNELVLGFERRKSVFTFSGLYRIQNICVYGGAYNQGASVWNVLLPALSVL